MFLLIDCNNFYVSCEKVFNPHLKKKSVVVLSNNDGCVIARSEEAKKIGIKMGDPAFMHKDKDFLVKLSSNFSLYADMSERVMQILASFAFPIHVYSIDEAFLECNLDSSQLLSVGEDIKKKIKKWIGIDVSVGMAKTKTLAKLANRLAKNTGGICLLENDLSLLLQKTSVDQIWGIGPNLSLRLKKIGVLSAQDLLMKNEIAIKKILGVNGLKTALELKQIPCFTLEDESSSSRKSFACCRSFYDKVSSIEELKETIANHTQVVCEKLRKKNLYAEAICIVLATSPFDEKPYSNTITTPLPLASNYTPDLIKLAQWGIEQLFKPGFFYKRCGIILLELKKRSLQPSLIFSDPLQEQKEKIIKTVDQINKRFSKNSIYFAAQGHVKKKPYKNKSPNYTTSWEEIPLIHL